MTSPRMDYNTFFESGGIGQVYRSIDSAGDRKQSRNIGRGFRTLTFTASPRAIRDATENTRYDPLPSETLIYLNDSLRRRIKTSNCRKVKILSPRVEI